MFVQTIFQVSMQSFLATVLVLALLNVAVAQVRTSPSYQVQSDSINIGGGFATSTSYRQESTVGEIATGPSDSTTYALRAGYQQMQSVFISLATTGDVIMSPDLFGLTSDVSNGSTTFTVVTDSPSGYQLSIVAENSPAMQSDIYSIADYNEGSEPDFSFITGSGDVHFGFTPEGVHVTSEFLDDGVSLCSTGGFNTSLSCWAGLATTPRVLAAGGGANHPSGATTTVHFRVGLGGGAGVMAGLYTATTTVTALPL